MSTELQNRAKVASTSSTTPMQNGLLQRKCECGQHTIAGVGCAACSQQHEGTLQRAAVSSAPVNTVPPVVYDVLSSSGQPLDTETRAFMEPRFGHDFSQVRVHTDEKAAESAQAVNALAYTVGRDVVFGAGQFAPMTYEGQRLLTHELTHVIQQEQGTDLQLSTDGLNDITEPAEIEAKKVSLTIAKGENAPAIASMGRGIQREVGSPQASTSKSPKIENLPASLYIDAFESAEYEIDYHRGPKEQGNPSKWIKLIYSDKTVIHVNIDNIGDETMSTMEQIKNMIDQASIGEGGRVFPKRMNQSTTPRLWSAKRSVLEIMDTYNSLFILEGVFPTVWSILTSAVPISGGTPKSSRRPVLRKAAPGMREESPPPKTVAGETSSSTTKSAVRQEAEVGATSVEQETEASTVRQSTSKSTSKHDVDELTAQGKVDQKVLKKMVIESWKQGGGNRPVKVFSARGGPRPKVRGYITQEKFIRGRTPAEMEKILGLPSGELDSQGAIVEALDQIPTEKQFGLRSYTQRPGGTVPVQGSKYPVGLGAPQWELTEEVSATVIGTVKPGQAFRPGMPK